MAAYSFYVKLSEAMRSPTRSFVLCSWRKVGEELETTSCLMSFFVASQRLWCVPFRKGSSKGWWKECYLSKALWFPSIQYAFFFIKQPWWALPLFLNYNWILHLLFHLHGFVASTWTLMPAKPDPKSMGSHMIIKASSWCDSMASNHRILI